MKGELFFFVFFSISWAAPAAYGDSQATGPIRAVATGLHQSHSNAGSSTHGARPGTEPSSSWTTVRFVSTEPRGELLTCKLKLYV